MIATRFIGSKVAGVAIYATLLPAICYLPIIAICLKKKTRSVNSFFATWNTVREYRRNTGQNSITAGGIFPAIPSPNGL